MDLTGALCCSATFPLKPLQQHMVECPPFPAADPAMHLAQNGSGPCANIQLANACHVSRVKLLQSSCAIASARLFDAEKGRPIGG